MLKESWHVLYTPRRRKEIIFMPMYSQAIDGVWFFGWFAYGQDLKNIQL